MNVCFENRFSMDSRRTGDSGSYYMIFNRKTENMQLAHNEVLSGHAVVPPSWHRQVENLNKYQEFILIIDYEKMKAARRRSKARKRRNQTLIPRKYTSMLRVCNDKSCKSDLKSRGNSVSPWTVTRKKWVKQFCYSVYHHSTVQSIWIPLLSIERVLAPDLMNAQDFHISSKFS